MIHYFFIPSKKQVKDQNCNEWDFVTMFNSKLIQEKNLCPHIIYTNDNKDLYDNVSKKWNEIQGLKNFKLTEIEIAKQDDSDNYFYELLDEIKRSVSKMKDKIVIAITGGAVFLFSWYMIGQAVQMVVGFIRKTFSQYNPIQYIIFLVTREYILVQFIKHLGRYI